MALYASLDGPQWDAPSLCAGWTVHQLLAHLTMPFRSSVPKLQLVSPAATSTA